MGRNSVAVDLICSRDLLSRNVEIASHKDYFVVVISFVDVLDPSDHIAPQFCRHSVRLLSVVL